MFFNFLPKGFEGLEKAFKTFSHVLKQIDFSDLQVRENTPEYQTYRTLVNHLLEGLADIEEGWIQDFEQAMKEIRKELKI
jgi:hypothetical protein